MKTSIKSAMGKALLRTGIWERYLRRMVTRGEGIVLTYHRVIEKWDRTLDYSQPGMVVTTETFDRQLRFIKQYFNVVPLSSLVNSDFGFRISDFSGLANQDSASSDVRTRNPKSQIPNSKFARPLCSITFDDGWRDNYEIAFPLLRKHRVPATVFLTTDFIGTSRAFWHTDLMYLLIHGDLSQLMRSDSVFRGYSQAVRYGLMRLARMTRLLAADDLDAFVKTVKESCDDDTIDQLIQDLSTAMAIPRPMWADRGFFLDWSQVREMASAGIEIGSHGCSHRILTRLKGEEAREELVRSKAEIERSIGQRVQHFAFPNGDSNGDLMALAGKAGYSTACLCASGPEGGRFGPLALRRLGMAEAVSVRGDGSFSEASLLLWLYRAPWMTLA